MASIVKVGKKYKAQISLYKHGTHKKLVKNFKTKAEAELWALEMELEKGKGNNWHIARCTSQISFPTGSIS